MTKQIYLDDQESREIKRRRKLKLLAFTAIKDLSGINLYTTTQTGTRMLIKTNRTKLSQNKKEKFNLFYRKMNLSACTQPFQIGSPYSFCDPDTVKKKSYKILKRI